MRNYDISIMVLNKIAYEEQFKQFTKSISVVSFNDMIDKMYSRKKDIDEIYINNKKLIFSELHDMELPDTLQLNAFVEIAEKYKSLVMTVV